MKYDIIVFVVTQGNYDLYNFENNVKKHPLQNFIQN